MVLCGKANQNKFAKHSKNSQSTSSLQTHKNASWQNSRGVTEPETKRKVIGEEFIRVFEEIANESGAEYLIQGTIYPDRIESGFSKNSDKIKSHHNVAGLPEKIKFKKILEPLRDLYKDEVRKVARMLDLPKEIVNRQPFPGPGLAVRIIGDLTDEKVTIAKKADKIVREEIEKNGLAENLWQYFAVLTDTKATGVKGDARAYGYVVAVRAMESREAMTASFAKITLSSSGKDFHPNNKRDSTGYPRGL